MHTRDIGQIGENVACKYLEKRGFVVSDRNFSRKCGELDIVARSKGQVHFFEVKSMTVNPGYSSNAYQPENNVHAMKITHLRRIISSYLQERDPHMKSDFFVHVLCVYLNMQTKRASVKWIRNIIL